MGEDKDMTTDLRMAIECLTTCIIHHLEQKEYCRAKRLSRALEILVDSDERERKIPQLIPTLAGAGMCEKSS